MIRRSDVIEITAETGALETQRRVKALPTIEPKRGEWIEVPFNEKCKYIVCSECGNKFATDVIIPLELFTKKHKFCHNCGADMRGKGDETPD